MGADGELGGEGVTPDAGLEHEQEPLVPSDAFDIDLDASFVDEVGGVGDLGVGEPGQDFRGSVAVVHEVVDGTTLEVERGFLRFGWLGGVLGTDVVRGLPLVGGTVVQVGDAVPCEAHGVSSEAVEVGSGDADRGGEPGEVDEGLGVVVLTRVLEVDVLPRGVLVKHPIGDLRDDLQGGDGLIPSLGKGLFRGDSEQALEEGGLHERRDHERSDPPLDFLIPEGLDEALGFQALGDQDVGGHLDEGLLEWGLLHGVSLYLKVLGRNLSLLKGTSALMPLWLMRMKKRREATV